MKKSNKILLSELIKLWKKLSKAQKVELLSFAFELLNLTRVNKRESSIMKTW